MDGEDQPVLPDGATSRVQVDNAIRAISQKKPVPEIDFTLHTMEDGNQVSTMERVCKGTVAPPRASARVETVQDADGA
jgi:serine/threonine-protein phosphatase 2B catalytic subunit